MEPYYGSTILDLDVRERIHCNAYDRYLRGEDEDWYSLFDMYDIEGIGNCKIELVENWPSQDRRDLLMRERHWIETMPCINLCLPIITDEERKDRNRKYREDHKEYLAERAKKWRAANIEILKLKKKAYYEVNKERILEDQKERYERDKPTILARQKAYREAHTDEIKERERVWREAHKEELKARKKQDYEKNKEKRLSHQKKYRKKNADKIKAKEAEKITCECGETITKKKLKRHTGTAKHAAAMSVLATKKTEPEDPPVVSTVLNSRANAFL